MSRETIIHSFIQSAIQSPDVQSFILPHRFYIA
jgi:hypothetical protein